jgi:hypothetical protein
MDILVLIICKIHTISIYFDVPSSHFDNNITSMIFRPTNLEMTVEMRRKSSAECRERESNPPKDRAMHEEDNSSI